MAKKIKTSSRFVDPYKMTAELTGQPLAAVKDESTFSVIDEQRKIPKAKSVKKEIVVEKKQRNITKPLGRPVFYKDDEERRNFNTMMRLSFIEKIELMAFEQKKSKATIIDELIQKALSK